jgi:ABC-type phosphate transport system substrate-binding protein
MGQTFAPNTPLDFCVNAMVGFASAPGAGYSLLYSEPSGTTKATYTVTAQTTPQSHSTHILDGARDVTSAGIGGLAPAVVGSTYVLKLVGQPTTTPSSSYRLNVNIYNVETTNVDQAAKLTFTGGTVLPGGGAPSTCVSGAGQVCVGPDGTGTTNMTLTGVDYPVYVTIGSAGGQQEPVNTLISITMAPVHAAPPTPRPTPTPSPTPVGGGPAPGFINDCRPSGGDIAGLGSVEVLTALSHGILPAFATECAALGANVSFYASTDSVALAALIGATAGPYTYIGMDRALTSSEWSQASASQANGSSLQQFPIYLDPLVVTYNIGSCSISPVQLGSSTLSSIFNGTFTNWNQVPGMTSCNLPILVAHDIDTASFIFKDYLSKRNPTWHAYKQPQLATSWPGNATVACTANGSEAMAMCVLGRPGMIGYGFYGAIHAAGLPVAQVDSAAGFYTGPVQAGCTAAADGPPNPAQPGTLTGQPNPVVPSSTQADWSNASLSDSAWGYPICAFNFITLPSHLCQNNVYHDPQVTKAFLEGVLTDYTQKILVAHGFAALPTSVMNLEASGISSIACR